MSPFPLYAGTLRLIVTRLSSLSARSWNRCKSAGAPETRESSARLSYVTDALILEAIVVGKSLDLCKLILSVNNLEKKVSVFHAGLQLVEVAIGVGRQACVRALFADLTVFKHE